MARTRDLLAFRPIPPNSITVPDFDGLIVRAMLQRAEQTGVVVSIKDIPAPIQELIDSARWQVAAQDPPAGVARYRGDAVVVDLRRDDGDAGVREPRVPRRNAAADASARRRPATRTPRSARSSP